MIWVELVVPRENILPFLEMVDHPASTMALHILDATKHIVFKVVKLTVFHMNLSKLCAYMLIIDKVKDLIDRIPFVTLIAHDNITVKRFVSIAHVKAQCESSMKKS